MKGDRVEAVVDTGQGGVQTFEIVATRAGRRIEVTTARRDCRGDGGDPLGNSGAHGAFHGEQAGRARGAPRARRAEDDRRRRHQAEAWRRGLAASLRYPNRESTALLAGIGRAAGFENHLWKSGTQRTVARELSSLVACGEDARPMLVAADQWPPIGCELERVDHLAHGIARASSAFVDVLDRVAHAEAGQRAQGPPDDIRHRPERRPCTASKRRSPRQPPAHPS